MATTSPTTSAPVGTTASRSSLTRRIGVVLAVLQALAAVVTGIAWFSPDPAGMVTGLLSIAASLAVLALSVPSWRGGRWPAVVTGVLLVLESLTGLPAFFLPGVPAGWVLGSAVGIVVAVLTLLLLLLPARR